MRQPCPKQGREKNTSHKNIITREDFRVENVVVRVACCNSTAINIKGNGSVAKSMEEENTMIPF